MTSRAARENDVTEKGGVTSSLPGHSRSGAKRCDQQVVSSIPRKMIENFWKVWNVVINGFGVWNVVIYEF